MVAAEAFRVAPGPGDGARHLLGHRREIAAGLLDIDEIDDDRMRAGAHDRLGDQRRFGGAAAQPGAAMDEHVDRCARLRGRPACRSRAKKVEPLEFAVAVGDALRRAEGLARALAGFGDARQDEIAVRRIDQLVVGVVERFLVHVPPDQRAARG